MDAEKFQEKMDPNHRAYLCRMLKMKELPEYLLEEYARVKKMTDRIDAHLSPGNLAIIAIMAGFNPDTGKFLTLRETTEGEDARLQAQADAMAVKPSAEQPLDEAVDSVVEETLDKPVEQAPPQDVEQPETDESKPDLPSPNPDEGKAMLWSPGMPVNVLQADDLKQGKIVSVLWPKLHEVKPVQLTVEFEGGETVTVNEDEVEAI